MDSSIKIRTFRDEDAPAIINCIRDEYGDTYHKPKLYDADYIIEQNHVGKLNFYVADYDGTIIGVLALQRNGNVYGFTSGITLRDYRDFHVFEQLANYIAERIENADALTCRLVLYHNHTQRTMENLGLQPCGFVPSMILAETFHTSFGQIKNLKHTLGYMARKKNRNNVGTLHIPTVHENITRQIYNSLNVEFEIDSTVNNLSGESSIRVVDDDPQRNCSIFIDAAGADLADKISTIENARKKPLQTFNAYLNISDVKAVTAYGILANAGYFFAGLQPLNNDFEVMILHNPKYVPIDFNEFILTDKFAVLRDYVKQCYESRCKVES